MQPPPSPEGSERLYLREKKWPRMDWQRRESAIARVRRCRVVPRSTSVAAVWSAAGGSGVVGCVTCGARHCAGCGPKIAVDHLRTVESVIEAARDQGYALGFITLTVSHHAGESADAVLDRLFDVWRSSTNGAPWARLRRRHGVAGFIRVVECRYGARNGWHPHFHVLFLLAPAPGTASDRIAAFGASVRARWIATATRLGVRVSADAQDAREVRAGDAERLASYMTKESGDGLAEELTLGAWKKSGESASPDQLMDLAMRGDGSALRLWNEYELASAGRRFWSVSRGLLDLLGVEPEKTEEEAAADSDADSERSVYFTGKGWFRLARVAGFRGELFARLAVEDESHVIAWVHQEGGFAWPSPPQEAAS